MPACLLCSPPHVAGDFQLRHRHHLAAAVQAALGLADPAVKLMRPTGTSCGGVDAVEVSFRRAPADRSLPVEQQRLQLGFPFQGVGPSACRD